MEQIIIRSHSPFRTHLSLKEHGDQFSQVSLSRLLKKIESQIEKNSNLEKQGIEFKRPKEEISADNPVVFEFLDDDSRRTKSELFKLSLQSSSDFIKKIITELGLNDVLEFVPNSISAYLFDDTIGVFEFAATLDVTATKDNEDFTVYLQKVCNDISQKIVSELYWKIVYPALQIFIKNQTKRATLISNLENHIGFPDIHSGTDKSKRVFSKKTICGSPMWTSRTVILSGSADWHSHFAKKWIVTRKQEELNWEHFFSSENKGVNRVYLGWGHNMAYLSNDDDTLIQSMEAMVYAQYYYALFDTLSDNLTYLIGRSRNIRKAARNRGLRKLLDDLIMTFNAVKINYQDLYFNLQGSRPYFLRDVMEKWEAPILLENIETKISVCGNVINRNYQKSVNRSQKIAEALLLLLSGVAILEYFKGIAEFSWTNGGGKKPVFGILDLGAFDPNIMQWIGVFLLGGITLLYLNSLKNRS